MIDIKLLTPENGFEDGVGIEYTRSGFSPAMTYNLSRLLEMKDIVSIRPLTGPMAIWNFAPEWADYLWQEESSLIWYKGPVMGSGTITKRPFWAQRSK